MRILHLPVGSGRTAWGLSQAERRQGHVSKVIVFEQTLFQLNCDQILFDPSDGVLKQEWKRWKLFLTTLFRYDVFHFHFGQKFFVLFPRPFKKGDSPPQAVLRLCYWIYSLFVGKIDIILLKIFRKKLFMHFHGDDVRQGDRSLELYKFSIAQEVGTDYYDAYSDRRKRRMAAYYQRVCHQVYVVSPDLLAMAAPGAKLIHYIGVNPNEWQPCVAPPHRLLKIMHAPTHRLAKGTRFIEAAVKSLRERGFEFEFILVEKMSNAEARRLYEQADLVIDQLLAGWFGVFAVELMAMAKPVIAYVRDEDLQREPPEFQRELPVISADPSTIESVLENYLKAHGLLESIGQRSRTFAQKWYDPDKITVEVIRDYEASAKN